MTSRRFVVWDDVGEQVQLAQWREALEAAGGNITKAGEASGFKKSWAMRLTKRHGLGIYAAELRAKATGRAHGRPRSKSATTEGSK